MSLDFLALAVVLAAQPAHASMTRKLRAPPKDRLRRVVVRQLVPAFGPIPPAETTPADETTAVRPVTPVPATTAAASTTDGGILGPLGSFITGLIPGTSDDASPSSTSASSTFRQITPTSAPTTFSLSSISSVSSTSISSTIPSSTTIPSTTSSSTTSSTSTTPSSTSIVPFTPSTTSTSFTPPPPPSTSTAIETVSSSSSSAPPPLAASAAPDTGMTTGQRNGIIVGSVAGAVGALVMVIWIGTYFARRRRRSSYDDAYSDTAPIDFDPRGPAPPPPPHHMQSTSPAAALPFLGGGAAGMHRSRSDFSHKHGGSDEYDDPVPPALPPLPPSAAVAAARAHRDDSELPYMAAAAPARKQSNVLRRPSARRKPVPALQERDDDDGSYEHSAGYEASVHDLAETAWAPSRKQTRRASSDPEPTQPPLQQPEPRSVPPPPQPRPQPSFVPTPVPTSSYTPPQANFAPIEEEHESMTGVGAMGGGGGSTFRAPAAFDTYAREVREAYGRPLPTVPQQPYGGAGAGGQWTPQQPWTQGSAGGEGERLSWAGGVDARMTEDQLRHQLRGASAYPTEAVPRNDPRYDAGPSAAYMQGRSLRYPR